MGSLPPCSGVRSKGISETKNMVAKGRKGPSVVSPKCVKRGLRFTMCTLVMLGVTVRNVTYSREKQSKRAAWASWSPTPLSKKTILHGQRHEQCRRTGFGGNESPSW